MFKNIAHSLEPDETPSYSASHQAPNYVQRPKISQNMLKYRQTLIVNQKGDKLA